MGEALLSRIIHQNLFPPSQIWVSDIAQPRLDWLANQYGVQVSLDNQAIAEAADVLLLAIKPQVFDATARQLSLTSTGTLIVSILAGVTLSRLAAAFPGQPVIRAMPNTPATVGVGVTALAWGQHIQTEHQSLARQLFEAVGQVVIVTESLMDAVTGLSGSGPAFVAIAVEALTDGGVAAGLPRAVAAQLALQTVQGTAALLAETQMHPAELKDRVTSPGGTTIAGVTALEQAGFRSALIQAVLAAKERSQALGS